MKQIQITIAAAMTNLDSGEMRGVVEIIGAKPGDWKSIKEVMRQEDIERLMAFIAPFVSGEANKRLESGLATDVSTGSQKSLSDVTGKETKELGSK